MVKVPARKKNKAYFVDDDAKLFYDILDAEWDPFILDAGLELKPALYIGEFEEVTSFASAEDSRSPVMLRINADDLTLEPQGICYDSWRRTKIMTFFIKCSEREYVIRATNELYRILAKYRKKPGNDWDMIGDIIDTPIYPSHKIFLRSISFQLIDFFIILPNDGYKFDEERKVKRK